MQLRLLSDGSSFAVTDELSEPLEGVVAIGFHWEAGDAPVLTVSVRQQGDDEPAAEPAPPATTPPAPKFL